MAALERLLRSKDFDEIGVAELATEAGVAVGTVYRRFENKEALVPLLFELWRERSSRQRETAAIEPATLAEADLRALLAEQFVRAYRFIKSEAHVLRAVHLQGRLRPHLIGDDWKTLWQEALAGNLAFLELVSAKVARTDLSKAAQTMLYLANTALVEKALFGDDGPGFVMGLEGDPFAREMADVIYGYLALPEAKAGG